jgi:hypothetical protein
MVEKVVGRPRRQPRAERPPRVERGQKIVFRVTAEERQRLLEEAGGVGVSTYVRARVFGGGVRIRDALSKIAALHVIGRRVQKLAETIDVDPFIVAETLGEVCGAINMMMNDVPGWDDDFDDETSV